VSQPCSLISFSESDPLAPLDLHRILPHLLVDFFRVEQALTLVIGEFVKVVARGAPSPASHILYKVRRLLALFCFVVCHTNALPPSKVFRMLLTQGHRQTLAQWILICVPNFVSIRHHSRLLWGITCLVLPLSRFSAPLYLALLAEMSVAASLCVVCPHPSERALRALFSDISRAGRVPFDLFFLVLFDFFMSLVIPPIHHSFMELLFSHTDHHQDETMKETFLSTFAQITDEPFPSLIHTCKAYVKPKKKKQQQTNSPFLRRPLSTSSLPSAQPLRTLKQRQDSTETAAKGEDERVEEVDGGEASRRLRERFYARMHRKADISEGEGSPQLAYNPHHSQLPRRREKSYDDALQCDSSLVRDWRREMSVGGISLAPGASPQVLNHSDETTTQAE